MCVIGLDLATDAGIALWVPGTDRPRLWTIRLSSEDRQGNHTDIARAMESLRQTLSDIHCTDIKDPITHVYFEAAILPRATVDEDGKARMKTNLATVYKLCAVAGMAEWFAKRIGAECRQVEQQSWRKHFIGRGTGKTAELKLLAKEACRARGWYVSNDHEADAAGVLDFGLHCAGIIPPWAMTNVLLPSLRGAR